VTIWFLRALFVMSAAAAGFGIGNDLEKPYVGIVCGIVASIVIIALEAVLSARPVALISSVVFGTLVGLLFATLAKSVAMLIIKPTPGVDPQVFERDLLLALVVGSIYIGIAFLYQTRDKFRVVIPYVEFRREERGARPVVLDTNVLVDGRIAEVLGTGVIDGPIVVPQIVLHELHNLADSEDKLRRERGRLGMGILDQIRSNPRLEVRIEQILSDSDRPVDERLVEIAKKLNARIMTNDYNLNRVASLEGLEVINLNELANAVKPIALPDERLTVKLLRPGEQPGQAVGYLGDGTMVVVEEAQQSLGQEVEIVVTNTITRETGRMIFGRLSSAPQAAAGRNRRPGRS
jgi:uncharacterized protein YacL